MLWFVVFFRMLAVRFFVAAKEAILKGPQCALYWKVCFFEVGIVWEFAAANQQSCCCVVEGDSFGGSAAWVAYSYVRDTVSVMIMHHFCWHFAVNCEVDVILFSNSWMPFSFFLFFGGGRGGGGSCQSLFSIDILWTCPRVDNICEKSLEMCICLWPEFDCPKVTLCGWQDIKVQLLLLLWTCPI